MNCPKCNEPLSEILLKKGNTIGGSLESLRYCEKDHQLYLLNPQPVKIAIVKE